MRIWRYISHQNLKTTTKRCKSISSYICSVALKYHLCIYISKLISPMKQIKNSLKRQLPLVNFFCLFLFYVYWDSFFFLSPSEIKITIKDKTKKYLFWSSMGKKRIFHKKLTMANLSSPSENMSLCLESFIKVGNAETHMHTHAHTQTHLRTKLYIGFVSAFR